MPNPSKQTNPLDYPRYVRGLRPSLPESLGRYVEEELEKLQNSFDNAAVAVQKSVDTSANAVNARIDDEAETRETADTALASRVTTLEASVIGGGGGVDSYARAEIVNEASVRASADSALATRATNLEATVNSGTDGNLALKARIAAEESARATADSAIATRTTNLEASNGVWAGNTINPNANFAAWRDGVELPTGWAWWAQNGSITRSTRPGTTGYVADLAHTGNVNHGIFFGSSNAPPGWYVLEADVELLSGDYLGSGMTLDGISSLHFATSPDVNGTTSSTQTGRRRFSLLVRNTYGGGPLSNFHLMNGWTGFGVTITSKTLRWYRCALRPASDAEIKGNQALTNTATLDARITTEETARISGDSALASSITTLSTTVGSNTSTITTLASSVSGLQARYGVTLDVNGYVSGFSQNNSGTSSEFSILADKFKIASPGITPVAVFSIVGSTVRINGNLIVDGSITSTQIGTGAVQTGNIQSGAVTGTYSVSVDPPVSPASGSSVDGATVSFTASGQKVTIIASCDSVRGGTSSTSVGKWTVIRRQSGVETNVSRLVNANLTAQGAPNVLHCVDQPAAGAVEYFLRFSRDSGTGSWLFSNQDLTVLDLKR
jgi:hypothetical protein